MATARELVDFASDAAFAVDRRLHIVAWNAEARGLLGYSADEAIGRPCYDVLQAVLPGGEPLCTPNCEAKLCFGRCQPFAADSCRVRHKEGRWIPIALGTIAMPEGAGTRRAGEAVAMVLLRSEQRHASRPPLGQPLRIFTLGRFGLAAAGRGIAIEKWQRKQALTLLKYLVTQIGRAVHRERLIQCLWPDVEARQGSERLKVTVYYLRRQLRAAGAAENFLERVGSAYVLRRDAVWVDAEVFEDLVAESAALYRERKFGEALARLEEAQRLYRGDYFEEDLYADWCAEERERLREIYLDMLFQMSVCHAERGQYAEAAQVCRTALVREPCRESFHRALMTYLTRIGRPDWAIAQYQRCQRILADELGVEVMPETRRLYEKIVESSTANPAIDARDGAE